MALVAVVGVVISGCGFFDDLFGSESTNSNSILSISNAKAAVISAKGKLGDGKSMCSKFSKSEIFGNSDYEGEILANLGKFLFDGKYSVAQVESKMDMQVHYVEIKESEKESICYHIRTFNTAFTNTKLTAQDIEQFEQFLAKRGKYKDKDDKRILYILKFFKYYNMIDKFYAQYDKVKQYNYIDKDLYNLVKLSGKTIRSEFVYGVKQNSTDFGSLRAVFEGAGDADFSKGQVQYVPCEEEFREEFNGDYKKRKECEAYYRPIWQWQKSIIEQSKQPKQKAAK